MCCCVPCLDNFGNYRLGFNNIYYKDIYLVGAPGGLIASVEKERLAVLTNVPVLDRTHAGNICKISYSTHVSEDEAPTCIWICSSPADLSWQLRGNWGIEEALSKITINACVLIKKEIMPCWWCKVKYCFQNFFSSAQVHDAWEVTIIIYYVMRVSFFELFLKRKQETTVVRADLYVAGKARLSAGVVDKAKCHEPAHG